ncbi:MAG: hypothetical protein LM514_04785, partial [Streptococcus sp.]|nr:hypothetical protein [Streptococcus sp.]
MGKHSATPINEAVFILSKIAPLQLQELRDQYPHLSDELREGISAGEKDDTSDGAADYLREKALVVSIALVETANRAEASMGEVVRRIRRSRSARLISQVLVLVGSSALLGAVALDDKTATIVTALLTLLAALGNLLADHGERLLNPQT